MVTLRLIELRSIIRASLHYKSFALYVTLADWLWQRARANHLTFLPVCVRMAAHAHYSVCQSVSQPGQLYIWILLVFLVSSLLLHSLPRQQKFRAMNGAHLASPIRGELGYAHWPQLGTQFIALLGTKFGAH